MSVTFRLMKNAKFHDGTPVVARDVKWSLDRAVTAGGFPTVQMKAGSRGESSSKVRPNGSWAIRRMPIQGSS